jgi:hypothetical protein
MAVNDKQPLSVTHPEIANQANGWDPSTLTAGSHRICEWRCNLGHIWPAVVKDRTRGPGCAYCSGYAVLIGFNDLATTHPEIAAQAHGWDPTTVTAGSEKKLEWRCNLGHIWPATVKHRTNGRNCRYCSGNAVLIGFNDLATTHPEIAAQAHGWDPTTVSAGSNKKLEWRCNLGHIWPASVNDRTSGSGCRYCSGNAVLIGFNDLATTHPEIGAQAHGWDPTTVTAGSNKKLEWRCNLGHIWPATVASRMRGQGCRYCSGYAVLIGFNDLATTHPEIAAQAHGWDPTTVTAGNGKKREWRCDLGHIWPATANTRTSSHGCPSCSKTGFDPSEPGWIYLVRLDSNGLLQIGISNNPTSRLKEHGRNGWEPLDLVGPLDGQTAREVEQSFLRLLDARQIPRAMKFSKPFDGYTEAWRIEDLSVSSLAEVRALLRDWDGSPTL